MKKCTSRRNMANSSGCSDLRVFFSPPAIGSSGRSRVRWRMVMWTAPLRMETWSRSRLPTATRKIVFATRPNRCVATRTAGPSASIRHWRPAPQPTSNPELPSGSSRASIASRKTGSRNWLVKRSFSRYVLGTGFISNSYWVTVNE